MLTIRTHKCGNSNTLVEERDKNNKNLMSDRIDSSRWGLEETKYNVPYRKR